MTPFTQFNSTQQVPSAWDAAYGTGLQYSRGTGFYRKTLTIDSGHPAMLNFEELVGRGGTRDQALGIRD